MNTKPILAGIWRFLRPVLIIDVIVLLGVGLSFLFIDGFLARAYSDRLVYAGIGAILVGGLVVVASLGSYGTLGTPSILTALGDARIAHERIYEHLRTNAKRYTFIFRTFAVGLTCIAVSALVEVLSRG